MLTRLAALGAVLITLVFISAWGGLALYRRPGPLRASVAVVVARGSLERVGGQLRAAGVIEDATVFLAAAWVTREDGPVHAAELAFPAHASLRTVLAVLRTGRPVEHAVTIAEGLTAAEIADILVGPDALIGPLTVPQEGAVLPQTYDYERGTTRGALLGRMRAAMAATIADIWRRRDPAIGLRTPTELLILASMVERETGVASERATVAAVFLNRLRLGMKLQSDPTAAYAATGGLGKLRRSLTRGDLALAGPVNTYVVSGLPGAPICAPGVASLEAAAHPAATDALYFVASGTGGHVFSASLAEHVRSVRRYRQGSALDALGSSRESVLRTTPPDPRD